MLKRMCGHASEHVRAAAYVWAMLIVLPWSCFSMQVPVLSMAPALCNCDHMMQRAVPEDPQFRKLLGAIVVVAANAGGAFTPIGDVTTTVRAQPLLRCDSFPARHAMQCWQHHRFCMSAASSTFWHGYRLTYAHCLPGLLSYVPYQQPSYSLLLLNKCTRRKGAVSATHAPWVHAPCTAELLPHGTPCMPCLVMLLYVCLPADALDTWPDQSMAHHAGLVPAFACISSSASCNHVLKHTRAAGASHTPTCPIQQASAAAGCPAATATAAAASSPSHAA